MSSTRALSQESGFPQYSQLVVCFSFLCVNLKVLPNIVETPRSTMCWFLSSVQHNKVIAEPAGTNLHTCLDCIFIIVACTVRHLTNGKVIYDKPEIGSQFLFPGYYRVDTRVFFSCDNGYVLSGSSYSICLPSGTWNLQTPTCGNKIKYYKFNFHFEWPSRILQIYSCKCLSMHFLS